MNWLKLFSTTVLVASGLTLLWLVANGFHIFSSDRRLAVITLAFMPYVFGAALAISSFLVGIWMSSKPSALRKTVRWVSTGGLMVGLLCYSSLALISPWFSGVVGARIPYVATNVPQFLSNHELSEIANIESEHSTQSGQWRPGYYRWHHTFRISLAILASLNALLGVLLYPQLCRIRSAVRRSWAQAIVSVLMVSWVWLATALSLEVAQHSRISPLVSSTVLLVLPIAILNTLLIVHAFFNSDPAQYRPA